MTKRIFKNTMIVVLTVILLCGIVIFGVIYSYFNKRLTDEIHNEAKYIAQGVEQGGMEYLEAMGDAGIRITWVASDGTVLYDNRADVSKMDNHAQRKEIHEAMVSSSGKSVRYSNTLSVKTVYYALRLSDGSVIRVADAQNSVAILVLGMMQPIIVVLIFTLILSGFLTYRLSKQLIAPLDRIDLEHPEETEVYEEMAPFVRKIILQNREIQETMDELKEKQNEFNLITENMQEGFIVVDKNAMVLSHNTSIMRLFGVSCSVENRSVLILNRTEEFRQAVKSALAGRHNERVISVGERFYHLYVNPVFADSEVAGAIIIVTDVTEKEERENLRREFSANVSHELKTPLTSISGIAEIIKNGIVDEKDIPRFAENIYDEAKRLIHLVEDIIRVSQLDEGESVVERESVDLYRVAASVIEHLKPVAGKSEIKLTLKGEPAKIMGVPAIIEEMIYNLCDNAVKYNKPKGKVQVTVSHVAADKEDIAAGQYAQGYARISVKDTGIGIAKDQQDRVFERFYRVDKSHSKEIGGTGLGLSIVKHGAKLHGADIMVESELDQGTTITVTFPVA